MVKKAYLLIFLIFAFIIGVGWNVYKSKPKKPQSLQTRSGQSNGTTANSTSPSFNKKKYSNDDPNSIWVVVNKQRSLSPINYAPSDLTSVGNSQLMRKEAADALTKLITIAAGQGIKLSALSGYRSYQTQTTVYNNEVKQFGQSKADSESAKPGYSEHQTGFAVDVGGGGCNIDDCFSKTKEGQWLATHAYEYGFVIRYINGKENITGYRAEPWHIRYIGTELSNQMHKDGITTLEEFFNL